MIIAVYTEGGVVHRVTTDDEQQHGVVLIHDGKAGRWLRTQVEDEISKWCETARANSQIYGIGTACEVASEAFCEISKRSFGTPAEALAAARGAIAALNANLNKAMALSTFWEEQPTAIN
jgi:hypothetical protein